jgi:hypothetical protein
VHLPEDVRLAFEMARGAGLVFEGTRGAGSFEYKREASRCSTSLAITETPAEVTQETFVTRH